MQGCFRLFVMLSHGLATAIVNLDDCGDAECSFSVNFLQKDSNSVARKATRSWRAAARTFVQQRPQDTNLAFGLPKARDVLGYRETGGIECGLNHSADLYRPIPDVLAEHPGVDGFCYFEAHAPWMGYAPPGPLGITNFLTMAEELRVGMRSNPSMCPLMNPIDRGMNTGPAAVMTYKGDNGSIITLHDPHVDCIHINGDVKYCHALGWLGNQVDTALMTDPDAWRALAETECERLNQTYKFTTEEITLGKHIDDQPKIFGPFGPARNLALHGYHKCLLGYGAVEMAYCADLSCLLPGTSDQIRHGPECI